MLAQEPVKGGQILRENLKREDLNLLDLRQHYWDQIHPRTGRFRPNNYPNSRIWHIISETFVELTEWKEPNFLDWIRGTYHVEVSISDGLCDEDIKESEIPVRLILSLDFTKSGEDGIQWTIDTGCMQKAAYPGLHSGFLLVFNSSGYNTFCDVIWKTPIFSPYVDIESPYRSGEDRASFNPISMASRPNNAFRHNDTLLEAGHTEIAQFGCRSYHVTVLQEILKDIARLLVFGPRYTDMILAPIVEYSKCNLVRGNTTESFFESNDFPEAAAFFSRAYCHPSTLGEEELPVPQHQCLKTVETAEALFEHYKIVLEPTWIKSDREDWVDELREEAKVLRTVGEWRRFETKWATITSYACGLNLHEGPWAGKDWTLCVDNTK